MRYEIRELGVGGILDQAIAVIKDRFWLFVKIMLVIFFPFSLISGWLAVQTAPAVEAGELPSIIVVLILAVANELVIYPLNHAAMIYAVANSYLNRPIGVGFAFRRARGVFLPLVGTLALFWLILALGLVLLVVPFIIFLLWYLLTFQVVVLEGLSGRAALSRSRRLMKGNMGTAVPIGVLLLVSRLVIGGMLGLIRQPELRLLILSAAQALFFVFVEVTWVIFYFSCRVKAEHFDLLLLADAVGTDDDQLTGTLDVSAGEVG